MVVKTTAASVPNDLHTKQRAALTEHYAFCDALRAAAILFVVAAHIFPDITVLRGISPRLVPLGYWGVDAFFVLSGFLLGRPYIDALLGYRAMPKATLYARRRFLRIWPAYGVVVLIGAGMLGFHHGRHPASLVDIVAHLTMLHDFSAEYAWGVGNIPLWTMGVDSQFYVALPIAAWLILRLTPDGTRSRIRVIAAAIVLSFVWRIFAMHAYPGLAWSSVELQVTQRGVIGMGVCFALGGVVALMQATAVKLSTAIAAAVFAGGVALALAVFAITLWCPVEWLPFTDYLGALSAAGLILGGMHLRSTWVGRLVEAPPIAAGAVYAYCIYLVHAPVKWMIWAFLERVHMHFGTFAFSASLLTLFGITSCLAAGLLHHFVEQPFLTMKERARETVAAMP